MLAYLIKLSMSSDELNHDLIEKLIIYSHLTKCNRLTNDKKFASSLMMQI